MSNIGILGGSFDPFHKGHLSIAETAVKELDLSKLLLIPTKVSTFKMGKKMASEGDRVAMVKLAARENDKFKVSTIEIDKGSVSYTYKTLAAVKAANPDDEIWFLMGTDSFLSLENWYKGKELLKHYNFAVASRPGFDISVIEKMATKYMEKYGAIVKVLNNDKFDVSSTEIKEAIKSGRSISTLVPKSIERYIYEHGLYK